MTDREHSHDETGLTRRSLLELAAVGALASAVRPTAAEASSLAPEVSEAVGRLRYLTPSDEFRDFGREKPRVDSLPPEKLREVGLDRETWQLEVFPDPESNTKVEHPLTKEAGTALDWAGLMKLAEKSSVRFLKLLTCTNMAEPLGMGLWEGVPLRDVIWMARPAGNVRRVCYWGYHNDVPEQRFVSSVSINRVLEDPPGELPIILCYKLNGQWLSPKAGGPVRLIMPEAYGNKSVKWLQKVMLTNSYQANDTYATWNNDVETWMKTQARFIQPPAKAKAGQPLPIVGLAQVGVSGLSKVQYSLQPQDAPLADDDPYLAGLNWRDAEILPPPADWGGGLPDGKLPEIPLQFDPATGQPRSWPLRYTVAHWAAVLRDLQAGSYHLRCRAVDDRGYAQPLPRPMPKSGNNALQQVSLVVEPA
ncbi:MAG: molybdopterin-dependent oxidoreductase [Thermoguttaceae bacterium]|nr:molybdopterin-dependent oxidoreductase [Thermoguttaceae bacterium]